MHAIRPTPEQVETYRALLTSEWDLATVTGCIDLVEGLLPDRGGLDVDDALRATTAGADAPEAGSSATDYTLLVAQALACLDVRAAEGDDHRAAGGFLRDVQSLLVHVTLSELLPRLGASSAMAAELVHRLRVHIMEAWSEDLAQRQHLLALLFDHLGQHERALRAKLDVFRLTPPTAHDYLTNAQIYWGALIERGDFDRARRFLLDVYRTAAREHLGELEEMLVDTFQAEAEAKTPDPPQRRAG